MMTTERFWKANHSTFYLTLDKTVTITETRFPQLDVAKLFAELGGTLGLWLGLGVIQMISFGLNLFRRISRTKLTAPVQLSVSSTTPTSPTTMLSSTTRPKAAKWKWNNDNYVMIISFQILIFNFFILKVEICFFLMI